METALKYIFSLSFVFATFICLFPEQTSSVDPYFLTALFASTALGVISFFFGGLLIILSSVVLISNKDLIKYIESADKPFGEKIKDSLVENAFVIFGIALTLCCNWLTSGHEIDYIYTFIYMVGIFLPSTLLFSANVIYTLRLKMTCTKLIGASMAYDTFQELADDVLSKLD